MNEEIFIDGVAYSVPAVVHRFLNDSLAFFEKNPGPSKSEIFGYDSAGQPYRQLPGGDRARLDQLTDLLAELDDRLAKLGIEIRRGSTRSARAKSKSFTVVTRIGTRPIYGEILEKISDNPDRQEIQRVLLEMDYSESSARNIAPTYLRYVLETRGNNGPGKKVRFSQLTEVSREGAIKLYKEVLEAIEASGGKELSRSEVIGILTDFGFSESSAQVRARYYMRLLEE